MGIGRKLPLAADVEGDSWGELAQRACRCRCPPRLAFHIVSGNFDAIVRFRTDNINVFWTMQLADVCRCLPAPSFSPEGTP